VNSDIDRVSILVKSVDTTALNLKANGFIIGDKETFKDVGTEEIYIGSYEKTALLLLQGVIGDGPYKKALIKRGYGLHHIAICTDDFEEYNEKLSNLGWYIHPNSMKKYYHNKAMFYIKPGVKTIIELLIKNELMDGERFIEEVIVNVDKRLENCINGLGIKGLKCSTDKESYFIINNTKIAISEIVQM